MSIVAARRLRRILAPALLALYAVPMGVSAASGLGHALDHAEDAIRNGKRLAQQAGMVHGSAGARSPDRPDTPRGTEASDRPVTGGALVHTHDGSTHAHGKRVAGLTRAADETGSTADPTPTPATVVPHLGTLRILALSGFEVRTTAEAEPLAVADAISTPPPPPPPRG